MGIEPGLGDPFAEREPLLDNIHLAVRTALEAVADRYTSWLETALERCREEPRGQPAPRVLYLNKELTAGLRPVLTGHRIEPPRQSQSPAIPVASFPGGSRPFDVIVRDQALRALSVGELKWSYDSSRDKIFEQVWDWVKIGCLLAERPDIESGWIVTGAAAEAWGKSECSDLFEGCELAPEEVWQRDLYAPGANKGHTVGEDLELGARGVRPSRVPRRIRTVAVAEVPIETQAGRWLLRTAAVFPRGGWARLS